MSERGVVRSEDSILGYLKLELRMRDALELWMGPMDPTRDLDDRCAANDAREFLRMLLISGTSVRQVNRHLPKAARILCYELFPTRP